MISDIIITETEEKGMVSVVVDGLRYEKRWIKNPGSDIYNRLLEEQAIKSCKNKLRDT